MTINYSIAVFFLINLTEITMKVRYPFVLSATLEKSLKFWYLLQKHFHFLRATTIVSIALL